MNSIVVCIEEVASKITRSMSSSLKYLKSKQAAERNSTSEREAISEKPEGEVMKPLAYQDANFLWELRKYVLLQASLAASIVYSAGMSPPGGFWPDNVKINNGGHLAGDRMLPGRYRRRSGIIFYFNATAFVASVFMINLLLFVFLSHRRWWLRALQAAMILNQLHSLRRYRAFLYIKITAFIASIFIVSSLRWFLWTVGMFCIMCAFATARSYWTLAVSRDGGNKFQKLFDTSGSEDHRDPALSDPRETVDADQLRQRSRKSLLLIAILAVTITYQAGLKPPGGLWQAVATDGHYDGAGDPVLHITYHRRYLVVFYCNAMTFMACLLTLILVLSNINRTPGIMNCALQVAMILDFLGAFAAGSCSKSKLAVDRDDPDRPVKRNNPHCATWRIASAAPHHMTGDQSLLLACVQNGDDGEGIVIHPATNGEVPLQVQGRGPVRTESIALDDVWYVPGLDSNLVSSGQLARQGCAITLGPGGCSITRGGALVGTGRFTEACQFELDFLKVA